MRTFRTVQWYRSSSFMQITNVSNCKRWPSSSLRRSSKWNVLTYITIISSCRFLKIMHTNLQNNTVWSPGNSLAVHTQASNWWCRFLELWNLICKSEEQNCQCFAFVYKLKIVLEYLGVVLYQWTLITIIKDKINGTEKHY